MADASAETQILCRAENYFNTAEDVLKTANFSFLVRFEESGGVLHSFRVLEMRCDRLQDISVSSTSMAFDCRRKPVAAGWGWSSNFVKISRLDGRLDIISSIDGRDEYTVYTGTCGLGGPRF
jgi:hypothetical protein